MGYNWCQYSYAGRRVSITHWECPGRQRTGSQGAGKAQQEDEEVEQGRSHSSKVLQLWGFREDFVLFSLETAIKTLKHDQSC